jgi:DNA-binding NtrC family response regulator
VLVVDDEEDVRTAAQAMLEECGFTVFGACDGFEALEMFRARAGEIGAVVLDVTMPRMSGEEVLREMRLLDPTVPAILSSGYHEHEAMSRCGEEARAGFLQKPYRMEALAEKVRSAIAARPRPA